MLSSQKENMCEDAAHNSVPAMTSIILCQIFITAAKIAITARSNKIFLPLILSIPSSHPTLLLILFASFFHVIPHLMRELLKHSYLVIRPYARQYFLRHPALDAGSAYKLFNRG